MKQILLIIFVLFAGWSFTQAQSEEEEVIAVIEKFFDSMRSADSSTLATIFHPQCIFQRAVVDQEGNSMVQDSDPKGFLERVASAPKGALDEQIYSYDVRVDKNLATAWTDFSFFYNGQLSHCGVNAFEFLQTDDGWKLIRIIDTSRKEGCITEEDHFEQGVEAAVAQWHKAATEADAETYFGLMTDDSYFIGTDQTERWNKEQFMSFAKGAFAEAPAWDFKTIERNIIVERGGNTGWFDEKLDTWMGICRGSGVVERTKDGWKIKHYVLSVTVPNDKINEFIELVKE